MAGRGARTALLVAASCRCVQRLLAMFTAPTDVQRAHTPVARPHAGARLPTLADGPLAWLHVLLHRLVRWHLQAGGSGSWHAHRATGPEPSRLEAGEEPQANANGAYERCCEAG